MKQESGGKEKEKEDEIPWDLIDRCLLPLVFSHAAAVILSTLFGFRLISIFIPILTLALALTLFYHNLKVSYAGKIVVVSGCESRIGFVIAKTLDDQGLAVIAGFTPGNQELKDKLKNDCSGRLKIVDLDVSSESSIKSLLIYIDEHVEGGIWAVVNAASWTAFGEAEWVPTSSFKKMINTNLLGTVTLSTALLPLIRKNKGRIINLSSIHGRMPTGPRAPLSTATAALAAYSEALRLALARWGVDVVLVEAGATTTGAWYDQKQMLDEARRLWLNLSDEQREDYGERYFEYQITSLREYKSQPEDLSALMRSVSDAVTRTFPLSRYTPVTKKEKLQAFVAEHLPHSVYSIIYN